MNRREALSTVAVLFGGTVIGAEAFLSSCTAIPEKRHVGLLSSDEISFLEEFAEIIIPATPSSPGAKDASVGSFMNVIVTDCYTAEQQSQFKNGIKAIDALSSQHFETSFMALDEHKKVALLEALEEEVLEYAKSRKTSDPEVHYYTMIKQLAIWGFLSSEQAITKVMRHAPIPGRYDGCVPLEDGGKVWA